MEINHFLPHQIDKVRWNATLEASPNSVLYANSWYLDAITPGWEALIVGEYEYIMPLPVKRLLGYKFVFQPLFVQRLGIFSAQQVSEEIVRLFLQALAQRFDVVDYSLKVAAESVPQPYNIRRRSNFVLKIDGSYQDIAENYSQDARKSLRKHDQITFEITENYTQTIANFVSVYGEATNARASNYERFEKAVRMASAEKKLIGAAVCHQSEVIASALFFVHNQRAYYVLGAPTAKGKKMNATHYLIDGFLREFAGKLNQLDFEGSDIPSVAYFYKKWGSTDEGYLRISYRKNKLIETILLIKSYLRNKISR